jgi:NADP-dependent 3-hydroxy acid dehydrogenase YdfG
MNTPSLTLKRGFTLACNAAYMAKSPFADHDPADWWKTSRSTAGMLQLAQAVLPGMRLRCAASNCTRVG